MFGELRRAMAILAAMVLAWVIIAMMTLGCFMHVHLLGIYYGEPATPVVTESSGGDDGKPQTTVQFP